MDKLLTKREQYFNSNLFPLRASKKRSMRFPCHKQIVFISARVHPGEATSSYALRGILKFLLNKYYITNNFPTQALTLSREDKRAEKLRNLFVFKIVPMINPDGVYHGHYRMDIYN